MKSIASYAIMAMLLIPSLTSITQPTYPVEPAQPKPEIIQEQEEPAIQTLIKQKAVEYGVSYSALNGTIRKETGGTYDTNIQSYVRYKYINPRWLKNCPGLKIGDRERSYGLAQIHICDHNITIEQATDPYFAVDFMAYHFSQGRQSWWMGYSSS